MTFAVLHLDDVPDGPGEEVLVAFPDRRTAVAVPLAAVGAAVPLLLAVAAESGAGGCTCHGCGAPLPAHGPATA